MTVLTADVARTILRYEPETGKLFWRERPRRFFSTDKHWKMWNTRFAGREAIGRKEEDGYCRGEIFTRSYRAHRIAWLIQTGDWPKADVDHINGIRDDNRWCNLREASRVENCRNRKLSCLNASGVNGVSFIKQVGKWQARIGLNGRSQSLGHFDTIEEATAARAKADRIYGFSIRHGGVA